MIKATLRLFNAIQSDEKEKTFFATERTIKHGYIVLGARIVSDVVLNEVEKVIGISGEKANAAFHKSWAVVRDSSMESLVAQQIIHYLTTYGFEALGVYREDAVYIPHEKLELPAIEADIPLTIIKQLDSQEILERILDLGSGVALAQETLDDIMTIVKRNAYESAFIEKIGNRELRAMLSDFYGLVPSEPTEFLRHLISKLTDESLLIKNAQLIEKIKQSSGKFLDTLLQDAPDDLASIFYRFKPLFLAMKTISGNKKFFNRLRKAAVRLHKPLSPDYMNNVTAQIKRGEFDFIELMRKLKSASVFRKIRLAYALSYRTCNTNSIVYRVRNGRGWATDFNWSAGSADYLKDCLIALEIVVDSIASDLKKNVDGKTVYIPANVHYALPATEKQFTGHFPTGSYVSVPRDLVVGIHWTNTDKRVDLDLSVIGESGKIGWDSCYRSESKDVLFSGDITDAPAPRGASELFYLREGQQEARILLVNFFNFESGDEAFAKIIVAHDTPTVFNKNYVLDVSNIIASANINITKKQNILGLVVGVNGENRVYFANVSIGNSITSSNNISSAHARRYLASRTVSSLDFRGILSEAGASVVNDRPDGEHIDLSPEALDKTTIIDLIK